MKLHGLAASGNMTNKVRVEKILRHLEYSDAAIAEILAKFPKDKKRKDDADQDSDIDDCDPQRGEAELLNHIINKLSERPAPKQKNEKSESAVPREPLKERPSKDGDVSIPPGCSLNVRFPNNASPNVQGTLPDGEVWKNTNPILEVLLLRDLQAVLLAANRGQIWHKLQQHVK